MDYYVVTPYALALILRLIEDFMSCSVFIGWGQLVFGTLMTIIFSGKVLSMFNMFNCIGPRKIRDLNIKLCIIC